MDGEKVFESKEAKMALPQTRRKVLVSGGAGFIGSNLIGHLLQTTDDIEIICVDNFHSGLLSNLNSVKDSPRLKIIEHDVREYIDVDCSEIYHLACPASPPHYQSDPLRTLNTTVDGTRNMLCLARKNKAKILVASTSEVYGNPTEHPQKEGYKGSVNTCGIRACYDEGKRVAETYCEIFHRKFNVDVRIVRIFNTYGIRMSPNDGRVVSNFVTQALQGRDLTIYGNGEQTRSFCYVTDLIQGLIKYMHLQQNFFGPVNLGNPTEHSINQIAQIIVNKINPSLKTITRTLPADDPARRNPDISKAKEILGWEPLVSLSDGLDETIRYFAQDCNFEDHKSLEEVAKEYDMALSDSSGCRSPS